MSANDVHKKAQIISTHYLAIFQSNTSNPALFRFSNPKLLQYYIQ